jgi:hypothetical protein
MNAHTKLFHTMKMCLLFSVTMSILGLTWGCGGDVPSQSTPDEAANARAQAAADSQKQANSKKRLDDAPVRRRQR